MLEIPESNTLAKQMNQTIMGKTVEKVRVNSSPHKFAFYYGDPENYQALLYHQTMEQAMAYGGLIELTLGNVKLVFGDGANVRYFKPGEPLPAKHQLLVEFNDGSALVCSIQMYGGIWAFEKGTNDNPYYLVAKEKPSPLTEQFNLVYFTDLLEDNKQNLSVKAFLATEQRIPGLGNGVLQDILFQAKINPRTKLEQLSLDEREGLFFSVKQILKEMTEKGGRDTEKDFFGQAGGYQTFLSNKTLQEPCPVCGGFITKQAYLGGSVYYCSVCQPIRK